MHLHYRNVSASELYIYCNLCARPHFLIVALFCSSPFQMLIKINRKAKLKRVSVVPWFFSYKPLQILRISKTYRLTFYAMVCQMFCFSRFPRFRKRTTLSPVKPCARLHWPNSVATCRHLLSPLDHEVCRRWQFTIMSNSWESDWCSTTMNSIGLFRKLVMILRIR